MTLSTMTTSILKVKSALDTSHEDALLSCDAQGTCRDTPCSAMFIGLTSFLCPQELSSGEGVA